MSGDGTPHEIVNAIMRREDKDEIIEKVTVGFLQGGSGNAIAT